MTVRMLKATVARNQELERQRDERKRLGRISKTIYSGLYMKFWWLVAQRG